MKIFCPLWHSVLLIKVRITFQRCQLLIEAQKTVVGERCAAEYRPCSRESCVSHGGTSCRPAVRQHLGDFVLGRVSQRPPAISPTHPSCFPV